jgi:glucose/arabinose dehydrogenase
MMTLMWRFILLFSAPLVAATLPSGFFESALASGVISNATAFDFAPDGRIFVCEQGGAVRVIKSGVLLASPFITFSVDSAGERGLLGVAFDPDFVNNQFVYFYYTVSGNPKHNRVVRVTASGDMASPNSEVLIFRLNDLTAATNHNGGSIHFGLDGKLYIGVGENATSSNSQTLTNLLGKLLRINKDGSIPLDNPFVASTTGDNRAIWALGLRNPFTFAVQPGSGRILINDVGQGAFEEIDDGIAGSNYGWPTTEGPTTLPQFRGPLHSYGHGIGSDIGCAISGGAFYNPPTVQFPADYIGKYFFADLCSGWIRVLDLANNTATGFAAGISAPVDLKTGPDGALYYLSRGSGMVFRVAATLPAAPAGRHLFSFVSRDSTSANNIRYVQFLFSKSGLNALNACYVSYDAQANVFYLLSDDITQWYGLVGGSANAIGNGQCTIYGATSGSTKVATDLTINLDISFRSGFAGVKSIYQFSGDTSGATTGWQSVGTWNDTGDPNVIELLSLAPNSGTGAAQVFTAVANDGNGANTIPFLQFLMNGTLSGFNGCFIHYERAFNVFFLLNDAGTVFSGLVAGSPGQVSNSQCTLKGLGSGGVSIGNSLIVTYNLEFSFAFTGTKKIFMQAVDNAGVIELWHQMGTWTR